MEERVGRRAAGAPGAGAGGLPPSARRAAQQVNTLMDEMDTSEHENNTKQQNTTNEESPTRSDDSYLETLTHQEEEIRANKEILEQLYNDIAELEGRKKELSEQGGAVLDRDSNSSRDTMSEMDAVKQLEREVVMKNKHIRKMLTDIKVLEEENRLLKENVSVVKEKLSEATHFIENLTEQVLKLKSESNILKETIGTAEEAKASMSLELASIRKKLNNKETSKAEMSEETRAKLLHWKNNAREKKAENESLRKEIMKLKEIQATGKDDSYLSTIIHQQEQQIKQLQDKLSEASDEILDSVKLIEVLKAETKRLKSTAVEQKDNILVPRSDDEDSKDRILNKMKRKIHNLSSSLKIAEETLESREQELTELMSHLQVLESGEAGLQALLDSLKSKKQQLKLKDVGIKSLVREVNSLSQVLDQLQMENEAMKEKLNIPLDDKVDTKGVLAKYKKFEKRASIAEQKHQETEHAFIALELDSRKKEKLLAKLKDVLLETGYSDERIEELIVSSDSDSEDMPLDGGGESSTVLARNRRMKTEKAEKSTTPEVSEEMRALIEENDGLRKGLEEILDFLKDNSTSTSGTLSVHCPSLEKVVRCLDARHAAGWYAPHMAAVLGLQAAIGGRDALLAALHHARKETFDVMDKLSKESEKATHLEQRLQDVEKKSDEQSKRLTQADDEVSILKNGVFGTWMSEKVLKNVDLTNKEEVKNIIEQGNRMYEIQLKEGLAYFHKQFKSLYEKMTEIAVQMSNDRGKWAIEEEKYKAEIFNLKAQVESSRDDLSENSAGVVNYPNAVVITRKCAYLEESYRYIRTLNENIKNEFLENERQKMILVADLESQIQMLILNVANLTDRLRNSISVELFLKQNEVLNELNLKYRKKLDGFADTVNESYAEQLEKQRVDIIEVVMHDFCKKNGKPENKDNIMDATEHSVVKIQLVNICSQLEEARKRIGVLEDENKLLQSAQKQLIDSTLSLSTKKDYELLQNQVERLIEENRNLKDQCSHVGNQLEIALLQLQDTQQRQMVNAMEVNMLRHQVLDLQSTGDSNAVIARLSGEILIAHLQTSETHKKTERLNIALSKEKQRRMEAEEMLTAREKIFNVYSARFEFRFRYMSELLQTLRQQYQGSVPLASLENYLNNIEELSRKSQAANERLIEVEDLKSLLLAKTRVFNEIIENGRDCPMNEEECPHEIKLAMSKSVHSRELDHYNKKLEVLEQGRLELSKRCDYLERTLILVNQGFDRAPLKDVANRKVDDDASVLEVEDIPSDDEDESRRSRTITLPKPQILKSQGVLDMQNDTKSHTFQEVPNLPGSPIKISMDKKPKSREMTTVVVQTDFKVFTDAKMVQTEHDISNNRLKKEIKILKTEKNNKDNELTAALSLASQRAEEILTLETAKFATDKNINLLNEVIKNKDAIIEKLNTNIEELKHEISSLKSEASVEKSKGKDSANEETKSLLHAVKKLEEDKNIIVEEYQKMLKNERAEYSSSVTECHMKITELQKKLDMQEGNRAVHTNDNPVAAKYTEKVFTLENRCFKLQDMLDGCKTELSSCQNELERWKALASERLTKIEQLSSQFEERHSQEVQSYRTESEHWLSQLTENQKDVLELRSKMADMRAAHARQLTEKDAQVEQCRNVIQNMKSQIMSMQSMISMSDPSFDLSAIIEVEEQSDTSPQGSDRLEIRFDSTTEFRGHYDYTGNQPSVMSPTWQETLVERLRREKQLVGKQNALLRRQMKALAGRERRARLDAQNLKSQVYRLASSGSKVPSSSTESSTVSLHSRVAALQSQLSLARRDTSTAGVAAWDKWKRAQEATEKWHSKYEEKCQELQKCEGSLSYAKSAVLRLEREKRVLLATVGDLTGENRITKDAVDVKSPTVHEESARSDHVKVPSHITVQSLMDRIEAQQRRIAALELADKGHEPLVSEYERVLSQNTMLKGQILNLESQVLESQLTSSSPLLNDSGRQRQSELEHLRSYCETLKQENMQLSAKVCSLSSLEGGAHSTAAQRIHDLEQTVLTLRGLVSKLQADQKKTASPKRIEMLKLGSVHSPPEQDKSQHSLSRVEVSNLRRSIAEKDLLLERSRELLKMAAEREEELVKEITFLRHSIGDEIKSSHRKFSE